MSGDRFAEEMRAKHENEVHMCIFRCVWRTDGALYGPHMPVVPITLTRSTYDVPAENK